MLDELVPAYYELARRERLSDEPLMRGILALLDWLGGLDIPVDVGTPDLKLMRLDQATAPLAILGWEVRTEGYDISGKKAGIWDETNWRVSKALLSKSGLYGRADLEARRPGDSLLR
jgi:hypothetical protein